MPYCVECGVELSEYHKKCPLCQTEVMHPNIKSFSDNTDYPDYRASVNGQDKRARRIMTGIILSIQLFVYSVVLVFINLIISGRITWSLIPVLSMALVWFGVAWPFFKKRNTFFRLFTYDALATSLYLILLNLVISGNISWASIAVLAIVWMWMIIAGIFLTDRIRRFVPVTLYYLFSVFVLSMLTVFIIGVEPLTLYIISAIGVPALVISLVSYFIIKASKNGVIGLLQVLLAAVTVMCLLIDLILHYYLLSEIKVSWSLIVSAVTVPCLTTLYAVHKSRELKSVIARKLHR